MQNYRWGESSGEDYSMIGLFSTIYAILAPRFEPWQFIVMKIRKYRGCLPDRGRVNLRALCIAGHSPLVMAARPAGGVR
jgi:hypothetical protein